MATTNERATQEREARIFQFGLANGAAINAGAMIMLIGGLATQGAASANAICVGVAKNSAHDDDGDLNVDAKLGCFLFRNSATDPIANTAVGSDCFIEDDETVAASDSGNTLSVAGKIRSVDGGAVWVEFT